jgi:hypothetical protein
MGVDVEETVLATYVSDLAILQASDTGGSTCPNDTAGIFAHPTNGGISQPILDGPLFELTPVMGSYPYY